jgi:nicotinamide-nucleotide amidase
VPDAPALGKLASRLAGRALRRGVRIATAESCTGGYIAKVLTDLPGSSRWFECGFVTYSNASKERDLGVSRRLLTRHGAVSEPVTAAMARGALAVSGADWAVAVSGVAGPDGGTPAKPVGTVWIAWARRSGRGAAVTTRLLRCRGDRGHVRSRTVAVALQGMLRL